MAISCYIWIGAIFRVPVSTLQRRTENGGLNLIDVAAKRRALLLTRLRAQGGKGGTADCCMAPGMGLAFTQENPSSPRSDTKKPKVSTHLCARIGVYGTQETGQNAQDLQAWGARHQMNYS